MWDGAPAHYAPDVRDWLDETLRVRRIGRRGSIDWLLLGFLDLIAVDFFLWRYLNDIAYKSKLRTLSNLKQSSISAFSICARKFMNRYLKDFKDALMLMDINSNI